VRFWWNRFGPVFAAEIRRKRVDHMRTYTHWRWHLDEVFVKINGAKQYLWRAVDHEGEVLEAFASKTRDKGAALKFLKKTMKRHGKPRVIVTDRLRSYGAAMKEIGNAGVHETGRWLNNRAENSHRPFRRRERASCCGFEGCTPSKSSARSMPRSTTISTRNATSSAATSTKHDAPPRWRSGRQSWAKPRSVLAFPRPPETSDR